MSDDPRSVLSRRQWVGLASTAIGSVLFAATAEETQPRPGDKLAGARIYNLRDFGAKGDGTTLDTAALQAAIDACHADRGGTVLVPAGDFVIGTVQLQSNVTLHLAAQARLLGSPRRADYSAGQGVPPSNGNLALLYAANAENISIDGPGTIDGQGANFYTGQGDGTGPGGGGRGNVDRPHLLVFYQCTNLLFRDAFFTRSAYHCCRILQCRQQQVRHRRQLLLQHPLVRLSLRRRRGREHRRLQLHHPRNLRLPHQDALRATLAVREHDLLEPGDEGRHRADLHRP